MYQLSNQFLEKSDPVTDIEIVSKFGTNDSPRPVSVKIYVLINTFSESTGLFVGVRNPDQVAVSQVLHTVAGRTHLFVDLETTTNGGVVETSPDTVVTPRHVRRVKVVSRCWHRPRGRTKVRFEMKNKTS